MTQLIGTLIGIYIVLRLLLRIVKTLQRPELRETAIFLKKAGTNALRRAERSLELPTARPLRALIASTAITAAFYLLSANFLFWYFICMMLTISVKNHALMTAGGTGFAIFYILAARWYLVSAERERMALLVVWKSYRM